MPFIDIRLLEGRSKKQHHQLIERITKVVSDTLDSPPERIRICIMEVKTDLWGIAGVPASVARADEIAKRKRKNAKGGVTKVAAAHAKPRQRKISPRKARRAP